MVDMPLISIIVPVFNSEKYLSKCIESITNQTLKDIEIILINDGSKDNSLLICNKYATKDNRIKVLDKQNGGVSSARNLGIENTKGEYIVFVDADDFIHMDMCRLLYDTLMENNVDLVACGYYEQYLNKKVYKMPRIDKGLHLTKDLMINIIDDGTLTGFLLGSVWAMLYKKNIIMENYLRFNKEINCNEDGLFNLDYVLNSNSLFSIQDRALYYYRLNENLALHTKDNLENRFKILNKCLEDICKRYPEHNFSIQLERRKISEALWNIVSSCYIENVNFRYKLKRIKQICKETEVIQNLNCIDFKRLSIYKRFYAGLIKCKCSFLLYITTIYIRPALKGILRC